MAKTIDVLVRLFEGTPGQRAEFFEEYILLRKKSDKARLNSKMQKEDFVDLLNHTFQYYWKDKKPIPELIGVVDIKKTIGETIYTALGILRGNPSKLLGECIEGYGIFTDEKMKEFIERNKKGERYSLSAAFFEGVHSADNAKKLVRYAYKHHWKDKNPIPELIGVVDIKKTIGDSIYTALGILPDNPSKLLGECIPEYGILTLEKASILLDLETGKKNGVIMKMPYSIFFTNNNTGKINAKTYLIAYLARHQKRLSDMSLDDLQELPGRVTELLKDVLNPEYILSLPGAGSDFTEKADVNYHVIQIQWDKPLEERLKGLISSETDPIGFMKDNAEVLWRTLGVSSFSAIMKAQELGLISATIQFGQKEKQRLPTYPLVEFDGYRFHGYAENTMVTIEDTPSIDTHMFRSPIHGQIMHVNVPIRYKGIDIEGYTQIEQHYLKIIAAYLYNPNSFEREVREGNQGKIRDKTVYTYIAPPELDITPRIVPIRLGNNGFLGAQVILPVQKSPDRGISVHDAVLRNSVNGNEVYLFTHDGAKGQFMT